MKRNFTLLSLIFVLCSSKFIAQTYRGIGLTGFSHDVIAESIPATGSTGTVTIDASNYVLYSALYPPTTNQGGLIASGVITSATRTYSLASYAAKNTLRVPFNAKDSLIVTNPASYSVISLLGFSSGIDAALDITLKFTDGSSVVYTGQTLYNWSANQPAILAGFGKTNRVTDAIYYTPTEPKMFSLELPIACANQTKMVQRIIVKNTTNGATSFLFAAAGVNRSSFVATSKPATCNGSSTGIAKALGVDVYGPLSYTWTPGLQNTQTATNLAAGNYTVTVNDGNGCVYTSSVAVTQAATAFSIASITSNSLSCASAATGSAQVTVAGGAAPYTYSWSNTAATTTSVVTSLTAGTYTVMATDANGCSATATTSIAAPTVVIPVSTSSLLCGTTANGTATVGTITGATGPFTYTWTSNPVQTGTVATGLAAGNYSLMVKDGSACINTVNFSITAPAFVVTTSATTCTLSTGSATVSGITGGSGGPYTYTWSSLPTQTTNIATGMASGNYTVTVKDVANCVTTKTLSISIDNPTLTVSTTSLTCGNIPAGTASVSITGGAGGPFTYTWTSNPTQNTATANNLASGVYSVTVKGASGCAATQTFAIVAPSISVATTSTACKNLQPSGSATVTSVNGGVGPYSYSWSSSTMSNIANGSTVQGLDEGTYTVTVTDASNCVINSVFPIASSTTNSLTATISVTAATCSGINNGKATVVASGGSGIPYSYSWNTNPPQYTATAVNLPSPNTFICSIIDFNNCILSKSATIYPAPTNILIYVAPSNTVCPGAAVTLSLTGLTGTGTYTWSTGAHTTSISVTAPVTPTTTVYSFTGTATSSCVVTGSTSILTSTAAGSPCPAVGINEQSASAASFNLYPNPNNGQFVLAFEQQQDNAVLEVVDALGKLVISQPLTGLETTVNTASLQNGFYFVIVRNEQRIIARTKIIKQ